MRPLTALEGRALGVLVEKAHTVPDSYPLSLNALTLGANQKTARDPVMNATEGDVRDAIDGLKSLHLVFEASGSRVTRYEHNMARALALPSQSVALLATLLLRGPQTTSELRVNCERLHRFADVSAVEGFLEELATRADEKGGPLVMKMSRARGAREMRWAQLMNGAVSELVANVDATLTNAAHVPEAMRAGFMELQAQHAALASRVDELSVRIDGLMRRFGATP